MPRQPPPSPVEVDGEAGLARIRLAIQEVITPAWVSSIPKNYGEAKAGTMSADQWWTLWRIYFPLSFLSLWGVGMPTAANDASKMGPVLDNVMSLVALTELACDHILTREKMTAYRECVRTHIDGLKFCFPGFILPSHHMAFHIYDFMQQFGPMRSWWCFPFERLIGVLQKIPHNHRFGAYPSQACEV